MHEDSRRVQADWLFIARRGDRVNGADYIAEALRRGAVVLCDAPCDEPNVYRTEKPEEAILSLTRILYPDLCEGLTLIGITGTNGKTSTAAFLYQCLGRRMPCMRIGTHHVISETWTMTTENTTPLLLELVWLLEKAKQMGISCVIMEVSSHAIAQQRIAALRFDYIVFTNIRADHLDFHHCEAQYRYTKYRLRYYLRPGGYCIVNHDDVMLHPLYALLDHRCITFGRRVSHFHIRHEQATSRGLRFSVNETAYETALYGRFQIENILPAIIIGHLEGFSEKALQESVAALQAVSGRMQRVYERPLALIDYAHTASAVQTLLASARVLPHQRLIVVIGCGGQRDASKRALMGKMAAESADLCIFTTDNPRGEAPSSIFAMMRVDVKQPVMILESRACALKFAVKNSTNDDIILIIGKGDEKVQDMGTQQIPFDDARLLRQLLGKRRRNKCVSD